MMSGEGCAPRARHATYTAGELWETCKQCIGNAYWQGTITTSCACPRATQSMAASVLEHAMRRITQNDSPQPAGRCLKL
eukprot:6086457-Alexandrium_andersonii.AAC.1